MSSVVTAERRAPTLYLVGGLILLPLLMGAATGLAGDEVFLSTVEIGGPIADVGVPIHALLRDAAGRDYALVRACRQELDRSGSRYKVLDRDAAGREYLLGLERRPGAIAEAFGLMPVLLEDGRQILVRDAPGRAEMLASLGFDVGRVSEDPLVMRSPSLAAPEDWIYDSDVAAMIAAVVFGDVWDLLGEMTGESAASIGGGDYTILSRHTSSGTPLAKATQYAYEIMEAVGLNVSYHLWNRSGYSNRNVVGEKIGNGKSSEIVLVTAHVDDMPSGSLAPGADDNGSGSVGVLSAAMVLSQYSFDRTVRFVLFTGEEQGLLGSDAYADEVAAAGENIVAVYNMDMIAWNAGSPILRLHTRTTGHPGYPDDLILATVFLDVVETYGFTGVLIPVIDADGVPYSDHDSFWDHGFPAILAIEDDADDFNPYYHTTSDTRARTNPAYFFNYVRASVGTVAHLAEPVDGPCQANCSPSALAVDTIAAAGTASNLNGILEPGEAANVVPSWTYPTDCPSTMINGTATDLIGPGGLPVSRVDSDADYGLMEGDLEVDCDSATGDCFIVGVGDPASRPAVHLDAILTEELAYGASNAWTLHVGASFADVDTSHWAYRFVESVLHNQITAGCNATDYCPETVITRWQMAVFLAQAMTGGAVPSAGTVLGVGDYNCTSGGASIFIDVDPEDGGCPSIHYLAAQGVTAGCGGGLYCADDAIDRWQMAIFLSTAIAGGQPVPTSGTVPGMGSYDCTPGGSSVFSDVSPADGGCRFIHDIAVKGITAGCGGGMYCSTMELPRDQMAVLISTAFDLAIYSP